MILTIGDSDDEFLATIRHGACGYIRKDAAPGLLIAGVRNAADHEVHTSACMVRDFLKRQDRRDTPSVVRRTESEATAPVTPHEQEMLANLCLGASNKEIARARNLSPNTVRNGLQRLQERDALQNRVQLGLFARDHLLNGSQPSRHPARRRQSPSPHRALCQGS